jgi:hypothetical protein
MQFKCPDREGCITYVLFLQCVITYSREDLLDRAMSTYQHYYQEYDFPKSDPLSEPPRAFEMILRLTQNNTAGEEEDEAVFWSDFGGAHTTHCFRVHYLLMSSL